MIVVYLPKNDNSLKKKQFKKIALLKDNFKVKENSKTVIICFF